jgi:hypothetical protein
MPIFILLLFCGGGGGGDIARTDEAEEELPYGRPHGGPGDVLPDPRGEDAVQHQDDGVVEDGLAEDEVEEQGVDLLPLEDGEDADRVGGRDEGAEGQGLADRERVGRGGLAQPVEGEADEQRGDDRAADCVEDGRDEVVEEDLALEIVARVVDDGREEA